MPDLTKSDVTRNRAYLAATAALRQAKGQTENVAPHRSLGSVAISPFQIVQTVLLPIVLCLLMLGFEPAMLSFWRLVILFWSSRLGLPLQASEIGDGVGTLVFFWNTSDSHSDMPDQNIWLATAMLTFVAFALTSKLDKEKLPLKYLVRILCFIQTLSLVFFLVAPSQFPYSVSDHVGDILSAGHILMFVTPIMLALGYYLLQVRAVVKVLHTILILGYFVVMIPHQVVLHALILHHFSSLFMPILYICFGAVFDVLIFVALYSWAASTLPARATQGISR